MLRWVRMLGVRGRACLSLSVALAAVGCGGSEFSAAATTDSGANEAPSAESGVDSGDWCTNHQASGQIFCQDFDHYSDINSLLNAWTAYAQSNGEFSLDNSGTAPSPPNALVVEATSPSNAKTLVEELFPQFATPPAKFRLAFDLRVDSVGPVALLSAGAFAAIALGPNLDSAGVVAMSIGHGPTLSAVYLTPGDAGSNFSYANATSFPEVGTWDGRYTLEIDYSGGSTRTGCVQIYEGTDDALLNPCLMLPPALGEPDTVLIAMGVQAGGLDDTGDVKLRFDNVTFFAQ